MTTEKFHWTSPSGEKITLPYFPNIKGGILRKHRKEEPIDFIFSVLEEVGDKATLAKVDDLEVTDLNDLFEQWQEATPGESSGSSA
jgi:hypothetical protein